VREGAVELAGDVALEYAADLAGGLALVGTPRDVAAGAWAAAHAGQGDGVYGPVQCSVAAAVEPVPGPLAAAGCQRAGTGEGGEGGVVAHSAGVGEADHGLGGADRSDAGAVSEAWSDLVEEFQYLGAWVWFRCGRWSPPGHREPGFSHAPGAQ